MGGNLVHESLAILVIMGLMILAACGEDSTPASVSPTAPTIPPPLFEGMDQPKADVHLVIIGEVTEVNWVLESSPPDASSGFCYYDATVTVERTIFGPTLDTITIRQARNSLPSYPPPEFISTKRGLKEGDRIVAFLGRDTRLFDLDKDQFMSRDVFWIQGQEVAKYVPGGSWGGPGGGCDVYLGSLRYERETQPLEEVIAWLEEYSQAVLSTGN